MDKPIKQTIILADEAALLQFAQQFAVVCEAPAIIYLNGELGAGKTTLVRGLLQGLGYHHKVKSPSYTLVEPYQINQQTIYHFDLYRLHDATELEALGIRDYCNGTALLLIEWPERGGNQLPPPDIICQLVIIPNGRHLTLTAASELGQKMLQEMAE